jgi:hypothetical protein
MRQEPDETTWQREGHELLAVIEASQSDLQRGAGDLAERFYSERPGILVRALRRGSTGGLRPSRLP